MSEASTTPSARQRELLEGAYRYALEHGLADLSLRPLAKAIGSSPRVLLYLFGSKDGLVRALLARARSEELALLAQLEEDHDATRVGLGAAAETLWEWLRSPEHRPLLRLWVEAYARSLVEPDGPWGGFAEATVRDWLERLARCEPDEAASDDEAASRRTAVLAVLRGGLLDLLATGDEERVTRAVRRQWSALGLDDEPGR